jgi:hypothetical protein
VDDMPPELTDEDRKLALLKDGYKEALDATKHQDDKIGRLLTAIAFLTAASLALANLSGGQLLATRFDAGSTLRLGLISLFIFLACVAFSVALLMVSLTTPLQVPGFSTTERQPVPEPSDVSQLFFLDIARLGKDQWKKKWERTAAELENELPSMYVREVRNLALRTKFKYDRTSEAVAIFTFGLLSLALAGVFVLDAATIAPCPASDPACADVSPGLRTALAVLLGLFTFVQAVARLRTARQQVDNAIGIDEWSIDEWSKDHREPVTRLGQLLVLSLGLAPALLVISRTGHGWADPWLLAGALLLLVAAASQALAVALRPISGEAAVKGSGSELDQVLLVLIVGGGLLIACGLACYAMASHQYAFQLLAGACVPAVLSFAAVMAPALGMAATRRDYLASSRSANPPTAGADRTAPTEQPSPR